MVHGGVPGVFRIAAKGFWFEAHQSTGPASKTHQAGLDVLSQPSDAECWGEG